MEPEKKRERGRDIGKTGATVAANVKRYRSAHTSLRELEARLEKLGVKISASGLQKIEAGTRRVDADELMALAIALNVNPNSLLLPANIEARDVSEHVTAAPTGLTEQEVWEWGNGFRVLSNQNPLRMIKISEQEEAKLIDEDPLYRAREVSDIADAAVFDTNLMAPDTDEWAEAERRMVFQAHYHAMNLQDGEALSLWHVNNTGEAIEVASLPYTGGHVGLWMTWIKKTILGIATNSAEASVVRDDLKKALQDPDDNPENWVAK